MGIFDFLKKFNKDKGENQSILSRNGLIEFIESSIENPSEKKVLKVIDALAKPDDDLEHLTPEGELPWGWHTHNKDFIEKIGTEYTYFLNMWLDARKKSPRELYPALKSFVMYLEDAEKLCKSKGECFEFYFCEILTSKDYFQKRRQELEDLTANLDTLQREYEVKQQKEEAKQAIIPQMQSDVILLLKENDGILQSDFWKLFDDELCRAAATDIVYSLVKEGNIERKKSGRSYTLHYKGGDAQNHAPTTRINIKGR